MKKFTLLFLCFVLPMIASAQIYLDPNASIEERVEDLLSQMTLAEKVGQMTQAEREGVQSSNLNHISQYFLGSVLSGGGSVPQPNNVDSWINMYNAMQAKAGSTRLGIPILYGVDAVHGHNNMVGAVIFPHNIGLGCTRSPELVEKVFRATALEMRASGPEWTFSPCITVPQNVFWGRTYEGFSENTALVDSLTKAAVLGLQSDSLGRPGYSLATAKHFLGDGGTQNGIDQGNTILSESELRRIHLPPYISAVNAGVGSVMASFNSWNGIKCHGREDLLTGLLKTELGFNGFVISDWHGIDQVDGNFREAIRKSINAGVDMGMQPGNYIQYIEHLTDLVNDGEVSMERIDDAVRRILRIKFQMGLFEQGTITTALKDTVGCTTHREIGRQAARESLVVLKNENNVLPLPKEDITIAVIGFKGDNIGAMCGGWTLTWQGQFSNGTPGTSILEGLRERLGNENVLYTNSTTNIPDADYAVVVVGEVPYAEGVGDVFPHGDSRFRLSDQDRALISAAREKDIPMIVVLLSGRPLDIVDEVGDADAFIAAWLPGTEGGSGIADVLLGYHGPTGKLSYTWPKTYDDVPMSVMTDNAGREALFEYGYGITWDFTHVPDDISEAEDMKVYPNPFTTELTIQSTFAKEISAILVDVTGRVVLTTNIDSDLFTIDTSHLLAGVYYLVISNEKGLISRMIVRR